MTNLT